ncbi:hypothetical protein DFH27DRAFT_645123 [Peziza echinospora]|nr:hypothetical protein DFH27DRAFT_645123 [Peziza echinospora]
MRPGRQTPPPNAEGSGEGVQGTGAYKSPSSERPRSACSPPSPPPRRASPPSPPPHTASTPLTSPPQPRQPPQRHLSAAPAPPPPIARVHCYRTLTSSESGIMRVPLGWLISLAVAWLISVVVAEQPALAAAATSLLPTIQVDKAMIIGCIVSFSLWVLWTERCKYRAAERTWNAEECERKNKQQELNMEKMERARRWAADAADRNVKHGEVMEQLKIMQQELTIKQQELEIKRQELEIKRQELGMEKEERARRWALEDQERARRWSLEDEERVQRRAMEDEAKVNRGKGKKAEAHGSEKPAWKP